MRHARWPRVRFWISHMSQLGYSWGVPLGVPPVPNLTVRRQLAMAHARLSKLSKQTNRNNTLNSKQAQPSTRTGTCSQHGRKEWAEKMRHDEM